MKNKFIKATILLLVMIISLTSVSCGKKSATTIKLVKSEGEVNVNDSKEKSIKLMDDMFLYNGYNVETEAASFAWLNLDSERMAKMDQNSNISVEKNGEKMDIDVKTGNLYFDIEKPLGKNEELNIKTSTMSVGIRGTSGWVIQSDGIESIALLSGQVETTLDKLNETISIEAMEQLIVITDGDSVNYEIVPVTQIPSFVEHELTEMDPVTYKDILKVMKEFEITNEWIQKVGDVTLQTVIDRDKLTLFVPINSYDESNESRMVVSYDYPQLNISVLYVDIIAANQKIPINDYIEVENYKVYTNRYVDMTDVIRNEIYITKINAEADITGLIPSIRIFFTAKITDPENGRKVSEGAIDEVFKLEYDKIIEQLKY